MKNKKDFADLTLLNCGKATHHADWNYTNICSPFARLHYLSEGIAYLRIDNIRHELTPGKLYLTPPFTLHSYECNEHIELNYIHIYENRTARIKLFDKYEMPFSVPVTAFDIAAIEQILTLNPEATLAAYDPKQYDNETALISNITRQENAQLSSLIATNGLINYLLSLFISRATVRHESIDPRVTKIIDYIQHHIYDPINLNDLSQLASVSPNHLIRLFKSDIGLPPVEYINKRRIEMAQLMLITEQLSIKEIAYSLSFENISYFNRLFRRHTGTTPRQYKST